MGSAFTSNCSNKRKQDGQNIISTTIVMTLDFKQVIKNMYYMKYNIIILRIFTYITH